MDVFDLFAKIRLDKSEYDSGLDDAGKKLSSFGGKIKNGIATAGKITAAGVGAASAAVGALGKASLDSYGEYEQLVGGVETLFGAGGKSLEEYAKSTGKTVDEVRLEYLALMRSQNAVLRNADKAYKTAGLSANEYMSTVTSVSASLIQSLDGDTRAAADKANRAIIDMSDNANKMGTDMEMIQNAYQGFAKQNFTMLDNLKLGYGGTEKEMKRLLADAEKLTGIKYDISSYADIVDAIHAVQEEMGIAGTTSTEASSTIEGSAKAAKAAWENLVIGIGDENANLEDLIGDFIDSVGTAAENIIPRVEQILVGIGSAVSKVAPVIAEQLPGIITTVLPSLVSAGGQLLGGLASGILAALPSLLATVPQLMNGFVNELSSALPEVAASGIEIVTTLGQSITEQLPELISAAGEAIKQFVETLTDPGNLDSIFNTAVDMITTLANGLAEQLPVLVPVAVEAILNFAEALTDPDRLSEMVDAAINLIMSLADGLIDAIPVLLEKAPIIIGNLVTALAENFPKITMAGAELVIKLACGILQNLGGLLDAAVGIVQALIDGVATYWDTIVNIGKDIINGVWEGIQSMFGWLGEQVTGFFGGIVDGIKNFLGIHSPSRVFASIGENMALGLGEGWDNEFSKIRGDIEGGMDFGTTNVDFSSSASGTMFGQQRAGNSQDIVLNITQQLDGAILARKMYRYNIQAGQLVGSSYVSGGSMA